MLKTTFKTALRIVAQFLGRPAIRRGVAAAILGLTLGHTVQADSGTFDIHLGGLKAGSLSYNATLEGQNYAVAIRIASGGLVKALVDFRFDGLSRGRLSGTTLVPSRYTETTLYKKKSSGLSITYANGAPQHRVFTPARKTKPYDADPKSQQDTLDPISLLFTLMRAQPKDQLCAQTLDLYDGRRRMQFVQNAPVPKGDTLKCTAELRRIAGFKAKDMAKQVSFPFTLTYLLRDDGLYQLSRIISPSRYGTVVLNRR